MSSCFIVAASFWPTWAILPACDIGPVAYNLIIIKNRAGFYADVLIIFADRILLIRYLLFDLSQYLIDADLVGILRDIAIYNSDNILLR